MGAYLNLVNIGFWNILQDLLSKIMGKITFEDTLNRHWGNTFDKVWHKTLTLKSKQNDISHWDQEHEKAKNGVKWSTTFMVQYCSKCTTIVYYETIVISNLYKRPFHWTYKNARLFTDAAFLFLQLIMSIFQ